MERDSDPQAVAAVVGITLLLVCLAVIGLLMWALLP